VSTFKVQVDVRDVEGLADDLAKLSGEEINRVTAQAINKTAEWADEETHRRALGINLEPAYLKAFRSIEPANSNKLKATVTTEANATGLGRYKPQVKTTAAKSPRRRLKGNTALGIAVGDKPMAVTVEVTRGARKEVQNKNIFVNPGLRDSSGNPLVMERLPGKTRSGKDVLARRLGPAPYQLFKHQLNDEQFIEQAQDYLERELTEMVGEAIARAIS